MTAAGDMVLQKLSDDTMMVIFTGSWMLSRKRPSAEELQEKLMSITSISRITFDTQQLEEWDSGLLTFLKRLRKYCHEKNIEIDSSGLPQGARQLLALAAAVPKEKDARKSEKKQVFLAVVGNEAMHFFQSSARMLEFFGDTMMALLQLFRGQAIFRRTDLFLTIESCSSQALPIVSLISFLVGLILAFVGAIQLQLFGAEIYVADLVGIAMVRLMAAIMTGIVMAGRTGGAFAAQLGTMQVNQEIDALKTMGISPMEFLVLPRMVALSLMAPLLCLYANIMGILGGMVVGVGMLDIGFIEYYNQTVKAVRLWDLGIGVFSSLIFGVIVALSGCLRGMECGRSASAVGDAATSAVVTAIVGIIVSTAVITMICNILGV